MRTQSTWIRTLSAAAAVTFLCGCLNLKPARGTARYFVLAPVSAPAGAAADNAPASGPAIGVAPVKLPPYLFKNFIAVRKSSNEVEYLESALWAGSLDQGFLRAFAADLAAAIPTDQVRLSTWHSEEVTCEVYVTLEQFDVDEGGRGIISAWWRVVSPGGEDAEVRAISRLACRAASEVRPAGGSGDAERIDGGNGGRGGARHHEPALSGTGPDIG